MNTAFGKSPFLSKHLNSIQQLQASPLYITSHRIATSMSDAADYVTLISSDGFSFVVQRSSACISGAIKRMLDPACTSIHVALHIRKYISHVTDGFAESKTNTCRFENMK